MITRYRGALREINSNRHRNKTVYMPECVGVLNFVCKRSGQRRLVQVVVVYSTPLAAIMRFHSSKFVPIFEMMLLI